VLPDIHQADTRIFRALRLLASEPLDVNRIQKLRIITRLARALYFISSVVPEHGRDFQSNRALQWMFALLDQDLSLTWDASRYFVSKVKIAYGNGKQGSHIVFLAL
jgi:hypothetical protein